MIFQQNNYFHNHDLRKDISIAIMAFVSGIIKANLSCLENYKKCREGMRIHLEPQR